MPGRCEAPRHRCQRPTRMGMSARHAITPGREGENLADPVRSVAGASRVGVRVCRQDGAELNRRLRPRWKRAILSLSRTKSRSTCRQKSSSGRIRGHAAFRASPGHVLVLARRARSGPSAERDEAGPRCSPRRGCCETWACQWPGRDSARPWTGRCSTRDQDAPPRRPRNHDGPCRGRPPRVEDGHGGLITGERRVPAPPGATPAPMALRRGRHAQCAADLPPPSGGR